MTDKDGEVRELTEEDFANAVSFAQLPASLQEKLAAIQKRGRPKKANPKQKVMLRIDPDVLDAFKLEGKGWQTRMNDALRAAILSGNPK